MDENVRIMLEKLANDEEAMRKLSAVRNPDEAYAIVSAIQGGYTKEEFVETMKTLDRKEKCQLVWDYYKLPILALACLSALVLSAACADGGSWTCPVCGETFPASYNFCPNDSTMRPVSGGGSWPYMSLSGSGTALRSLKDESARHQSFFGPNRKNYPGAGAYKPYKVSRATALFREGDYVLVDMSYTTVGRRCVYFKASSLTNASVQAVTLSGHSARVRVGEKSR